MAGEWIKIRTNLWNDPRVSQLCDLTKSREACVIGALYWLWASADEHTETGLMPGLSVAGIDRKTGIKGFGAALVTIGWISDTPEGVEIVRFSEHNGASAKQRAQTAKRVSNHKGNAKVTLKTENANAPSVSSALPREEKRREELKDIPQTPQAGLPSKSKNAITLKAYLEKCRELNAKPIPADDSVFDYAGKVGLPDDFLRLQWREFKDRYLVDGAKRYKAWPSVYGKSVRGNWFKLWYALPDGGFALTTVGQQAQRFQGEGP